MTVQQKRNKPLQSARNVPLMSPRAKFILYYSSRPTEDSHQINLAVNKPQKNTHLCSWLFLSPSTFLHPHIHSWKHSTCWAQVGSTRESQQRLWLAERNITRKPTSERGHAGVTSVTCGISCFVVHVVSGAGQPPPTHPRLPACLGHGPLYITSWSLDCPPEILTHSSTRQNRNS